MIFFTRKFISIIFLIILSLLISLNTASGQSENDHRYSNSPDAKINNHGETITGPILITTPFGPAPSTPYPFQKEVTPSPEETPKKELIEETPTSIPITGIKSDKQTGAPVIFFGQTLFYINTERGGFSSKERAEIITDRLKELYDNYKNIETDLIIVTRDITGVYIVYDRSRKEDSEENIKYENIMMVDEEEAKFAGLTTLAMGEVYAKKIREAIEIHRKETSIKGIITGIIYTAITTAVLILLFIAFGKIFRGIEKFLNLWEGTYIKDLKFQKLVILTSERIVGTVIIITHIILFIIKILLIYIYLALTLGFFIWTKVISARLLDYTIDGLKMVGLAILSYIPNLFVIFLTIYITYYILKFIYFIFNALEKGYIAIPGFHRDWSIPTYKIVRFLIIILSIVIIYPYLPGGDTSAFKAVSVFFGILLSLGSSSSVSNIIAGIILTYTNAFKIGDRVKISDTVGDVVETNLLVTHIRTIKNTDITIPNSMVLGNHIINYSSSAQRRGLILHTTVTLGYDIPWRKVHRALIEAALCTGKILKTPSPFVFQTSLDDNYVSYELNAYTNKPNDMANIYSELHQNIQDKCNEADIEILSPHYRAVRDGNMTAIPEEYLQENYKAPSFNVSVEKDEK